VEVVSEIAPVEGIEVPVEPPPPPPAVVVVSEIAPVEGIEVPVETPPPPPEVEVVSEIAPVEGIEVPVDPPPPPPEVEVVSEIAPEEGIEVPVEPPSPPDVEVVSEIVPEEEIEVPVEPPPPPLKLDGSSVSPVDAGIEVPVEPAPAEWLVSGRDGAAKPETMDLPQALPGPVPSEPPPPTTEEPTPEVLDEVLEPLEEVVLEEVVEPLEEVVPEIAPVQGEESLEEIPLENIAQVSGSDGEPAIALEQEPTIELADESVGKPEAVATESVGEAPQSLAPPRPGTSVEAQPAAPLSRLLRPDDPGALMMELFPGISKAEALELGATLKLRELGTGETLIREGEKGDSLFLVMEGCLEASGRFEGTTLRLALLGRCDVLGEVAFLKNVPRTATVLALEPSVVMELSRGAVAAHFQDRPELLDRLEGILEERVDNTIRALKNRWKAD
jgi:hypothetical protein